MVCDEAIISRNIAFICLQIKRTFFRRSVYPLVGGEGPFGCSLLLLKSECWKGLSKDRRAFAVEVNCRRSNRHCWDNTVWRYHLVSVDNLRLCYNHNF